MKKELWEILPQRAREAHAIADFLGLPPLAASVLAARGYGPESAKALLSCEDVLCDPLLMKDLDRAAQTVAETVDCYEVRLFISCQPDEMDVTQEQLLYPTT